MEYHIHIGKIVGMSISSDQQNLVTCSEDGSIFQSSIKEICNGVDMSLNITLIGNSQQNQEAL